MIHLLPIYIPIVFFLIFSIKKSKILISFCVIVSLLSMILILSSNNNTLTISTNIPISVSLNCYLAYKIDTISRIMLLLSDLLFFIIVLYFYLNNKNYNYLKYIAIIIFLVNTAVTVSNMLIFYICSELIVVNISILLFKTIGNKRSVWTYIISNLIGGFALLISIVLTEMDTFHYSSKEKMLLFILMLLYFLIKLPIWPFSQWLIGLVNSRTPLFIILLLSSLVDKLSIYGTIRYLYPILGKSYINHYGIYIVIPIVISIFVTLFLSLNSDDIIMRYLLISISHLNFALFSILNWDNLSITGVEINLLVHGISGMLVYLSLDFILNQLLTDKINNIFGIRSILPLISSFLFIGILSSIGLPGFGEFISELFMFIGNTHYLYLNFLLIIPLFISAYSLLDIYKKNFNREFNLILTVNDISISTVFLFISLTLISILLCMYPNMLF